MSGLKVDQLAASGGTLPPDTIVDVDGEPTTNPRALKAGGAHLPFGQHKGYGFMLAAEVFGRIATGADEFSDARRGGPWMRHAGYLLAGFAVDAFVGRDRYDDRVNDLFGRVRAVAPSRGYDRVLIPGDLEAASRAGRSEGLDYPDQLLSDIARLSTPPEA
jgi:LDH2 family malate/lactate/ureidoglycolate dehydrogenase